MQKQQRQFRSVKSNPLWCPACGEALRCLFFLGFLSSLLSLRVRMTKWRWIAKLDGLSSLIIVRSLQNGIDTSQTSALLMLRAPSQDGRSGSTLISLGYERRWQLANRMLQFATTTWEYVKMLPGRLRAVNGGYWSHSARISCLCHIQALHVRFRISSSVYFYNPLPGDLIRAAAMQSEYCQRVCLSPLFAYVLSIRIVD